MQKQLAIKLLTICLLAILLLIPIGMIGGKINERQQFMQEARQSIAQSWTGEQVLYTPILVQPYVVERSQKKDPSVNNYLFDSIEVKEQRLIVPDSVSVHATVETQKRMRGIYAVPVYTADLQIEGELVTEQIEQALEEIRTMSGFVRLEQPYISMSVQDPRGIMGTPAIRINEATIPFSPGTKIRGISSGVHGVIEQINAGPLQFDVRLKLRGMESLSFVPVGLSASIQTSSIWPHPEFTGAFLPDEHSISKSGFNARWETNQFSTNILHRVQSCQEMNCELLQGISHGVKFIEGVDIYLQSERASKYGILFVGLTFIIFFIFEILKNMRIHAIQYGLVGAALSIFYLILVSLGEHLSFTISYWIAATACISLLTYYIRHVLKAWNHALLFSGIFSGLYGLLFVIIQAEDYAFLMGALLMFAVLAGIMIVTRNMDWFELQVPTAKQDG